MVIRNAVIRVDASPAIGMGHLVRCISLANQMRSRGVNVAFICRVINCDQYQCLENDGFTVYRLFGDYLNELEDADQTRAALRMQKNEVELLVVDHYRLGASWESRVRPTIRKIMVIDDGTVRHHDCDILLNQDVLFDDQIITWQEHVSSHCKLFMGPRYLLLRDEFNDVRKELKVRTGAIGRVLVSFGGSDQTCEIEKVLKAIQMSNMQNVHVDVIVRSDHQKLKELERYADCMQNIHLIYNISNMAAVMNSADLAIGAGGMMNWERCYLGLPSLVTVTAHNQNKLMTDLDRLGAVVLLGRSQDLLADDYAKAIKDVISNPKKCKALENRAMLLVKRQLIDSVYEYVLRGQGE